MRSLTHWSGSAVCPCGTIGPDKTAADADTVQTVRALHEKLIGLDARMSRTGSVYTRGRRVQGSGFV